MSCTLAVSLYFAKKERKRSFIGQINAKLRFLYNRLDHRISRQIHESATCQDFPYVISINFFIFLILAGNIFGFDDLCSNYTKNSIWIKWVLI